MNKYHDFKVGDKVAIVRSGKEMFVTAVSTWGNIVLSTDGNPKDTLCIDFPDVTKEIKKLSQ